MKLLLDTHILLWAAGDVARLPKVARALIEDERNELHFSAASIWEVAIKSGIGRADFQVQPHIFRRGLLDNGYGEVLISGRHAAATAHLEAHHKDPFDRMLVAQASEEELLLVTADKKLSEYPGPIRLV